jgi:CheY-like chemotaxis protein
MGDPFPLPFGVGLGGHTTRVRVLNGAASAEGFPAACPPEPPDPLRMPSRTPPASASERLEGGILVLEPDPDLQWRLARMLTLEGYRVVGTSTLESAKSVLLSWGADAVLVSEHVRGLAGAEVAAQLKDAHPDVPIVLLGQSSGAFEAVTTNSPVRARIDRPFRWDKFREVLRALAVVPVLSRKR